MPPRPILKPTLDPSLFSHPACYPSPLSALPYRPPSRCASTSSGTRSPSPHVHFPPTPTLASTLGTTHSPSVYDRAPIVVIPNSCALPARGERVYHTLPSSPSSSLPHFHSGPPRPRVSRCSTAAGAVAMASNSDSDSETSSPSPTVGRWSEGHGRAPSGTAAFPAFYFHHPRPVLHRAVTTVTMTAATWSRRGSNASNFRARCPEELDSGLNSENRHLSASRDDSDANRLPDSNHTYVHARRSNRLTAARRWQSVVFDSSEDSETTKPVERADGSGRRAIGGFDTVEGLSLDGCLGGF